MRLRGWHVEGFGLLCDFRVEGLPDGLTVVFGPNEAGKTSLLSFIRGALFGYPDRRKRDRQYPPLRGGRHGGRLLVESDGSIWTLERFASPARLTITLPDGSPGTEADLRRLLGGVDAELYRNVFAFSLSELQEFETLQVEGVRDRIFAAGVVGAGRSARSAIEAFAAERADIGKKRGECRINGLRKRVDELDEALRQAKARATRHPELRHSADALDEEQRRIGRELADARREMARLDALLAAWPDWGDRAQTEAELATLADTPTLPDDFAARLDSALAAAGTQRERYEERRQTVVDLEQQLAALVPDDRLAAEFVEVKRLAAQIGSMRARRERLGALRTQCEMLHKRVDEEAPRLGSGWTSTSVRSFDTSIPAAQVIADWGERIREAEEAVRDAEKQADQLASSAREVADEVSRRAEALKGAPQPPDAPYLSDRDAAIRRMRPKLTELVALRADLHAAEQRLTEATRRATEARDNSLALNSELERRAADLRSASALSSPEDLARRERAVRELRTGLAGVASARADLRAGQQRARDAKQRADEADLSVSADADEVQRRQKALAEAPSVPDQETIATNERVARELRAKLAEVAILRSDLHAAEIRCTDRRRDAERRGAPVTAPSIKRLLLSAAVVLGVLAVVLLLVSQFIAAGLAVGTGILAAILALRSPATSSIAADDAANAIVEAERSAQELATRLGSLEGLAMPLAARLGLGACPDPAALEAKSDEIAAQSRARQDRDRESVAIEQRRAAVQRSHGAAQRLRAAAASTQAEVDSVLARQLQDSEAANLTIARSLGFTELPTVAALEEKAAEVRDAAEKRRERDREVSSVQSLELEAERARTLAARLEGELPDLRREIESSHAARMRNAEESALSVAISLGFQAIPEPADLELKAKEVDDQIRSRQERDRETLALVELRRRTEVATVAAEKASEAAAARRQDRDLSRGEWSRWKAENRCPEALRPETAQQFFGSVARLRESLGQLDAWEAESAKIESEVGDFSRAVVAAAEQVGLANPSETALAEDLVEILREQVEADAGIRAERARLGGDLDRARNVQATSERDSCAAAVALTSVLAEAGASDERDCRARIETSRRRADLRKRVRDAEHRLHTRLGVGTQSDAVRDELVCGDRQGWEARKQECKATLARLQPEHEEALRRHQTAVEMLSALERECDVVTLAIDREGVIAEIREALWDWRRLAIAQSLVQATLRGYELERQPAVLTRAGVSFSRITEGRYTRLVTREDGIDLIAADGSRLAAMSLSRGTAEQLYLCLRLALAAEFGRLAVPLPLVMDDVLVNFDPERARLAAQVLLDATVDHQILLFTCHPETLNLLVDLDPSLKVVEIGRQTPVERPVDFLERAVGFDSAAVPAASSRQVASQPGLEFAEAVLSSIRAAGRPLSRAEILASTGMPEAHWPVVIQELRSRELVVSHGRKRGTTWGAAEWTAPPPDED